MRQSIATALSLGFATFVGMFATPPPAFAEQTVYPGFASALPGVIEVEDYDLGGEGVAYHDSTPTNDAGAAACRAEEGVDVEKQPALETCDVGWITPGEWLEYSVDVYRWDFDYTVRVHHASLGPGGTMHIEFDGVDVTGPIVLPDTGGWTTWGTTEVTGVRLAPTRSQTMRVMFDSGNAEGWLANIDRIEFFNPADVGQTRFPGAARGGRIQAEEYDLGGEGIAYHDTTPENEPGHFRSDGVDIEATQDEGGGYDVGWVRPGEWLEYTRNASADPHTFHIRYASDGPGGVIHLERDGVDVTGPISLPSTGGWQNWQTFYIQRLVSLPGPYRLRVVFDQAGVDGWLANVNYIDVKLGPWPQPSPLPKPLPGTIEVEQFSGGGEGVAYHDATPQNEPGAGDDRWRNEGVDVEVTQDEGGGYDVGWIRAGEWLMYNVSVEPGVYAIEIRHAADGPGGVMHLEVNGTNITGPIQLPDTGGWQTWQTVTVPNVRITEGGLLRLSFNAGNAEGWLSNINWIRFTRTGS